MNKEFCEDCADRATCNGDCPYFESEQTELEEKAKKIKIDHGARATTQKEKKPRTVKISNEKQTLFSDIVGFLMGAYDDVTVIKENKLIQVGVNGKTFKVDLIEQRAKKE